jgi:Big-like domain-containing protein/VCBS repeat protein
MRVMAAIGIVAVTACGSPAEPSPRAFDPAQSSVEVTPNRAEAGGTVEIRVTLRDASGAPVEGASVEVAATGSGNSLVQGAATDKSGVTTATLLSTRAEQKTITATGDGETIGTASATFVPGPPALLGFVAQPSQLEAGEPFALAVEITDQFLNRTDSDAAVFLELLANPAGGVLHGALVIGATAGLADFSNLHLDVPGTGYVVVATATGFADIATLPFDVVPGAPALATSRLVATPPSADADGQTAMPVLAHVANQYGIALQDVPVTLAVTGSGNTLAPAAGVTASSGDFTSALTSTVAEVKTLTATAATLELSIDVHFFPPACIPVLPGRPLQTVAGSPSVDLVADLDGDGFLDVVVGEPGRLEIFRGRGDGRVRGAIAKPLGGTPLALAAGDVDADGVVDVVAVTQGIAALRVLKGLGGGQLADPVAIPLASAPRRVVMVDLDKDGDRDLVASLTDGDALAIELNTGAGAFAAAANVPTGTGPIEIAVADINVDGKLDVLAANANNRTMTTALGLGNGTFRAPVTRFSPEIGKLLVTAIDADTSPDLVIVDSQLDEIAIEHGNRDGTFTILTEFASGLPSQTAVAADVDGDAKTDLVLGGIGTVSVLLGTGTGTFGAAQRLAASAFAGLALVDMNRDGTRDLVTTGAGLGIVTGLAGGRFLAAPITPRPTGFLLPTSADLDGDGSSDGVRWDSDKGLSAVLSNPDGTFHDGPALAHGQPSDGVLGDVDGDGRADLVLTTATGGAAEVAFGNGTGGFGAAAAIAQTTSADAPLLVDVDGDGRLDLVLSSTSPASTSLLLGHGLGTGAFAPITLVATGSRPGRTVAADVDGDGAVDLVSPTDGAIEVIRGDGIGAFQPPVPYPLSGNVLARDFDGDGLPELAVTRGDGTLAVMHDVAGSYVQTDVYAIAPVFGSLNDIAATDVDGDGTLDLVIATRLGVHVLQGFGDGYFRPARNYGLVLAAPSVVAAIPFTVGDRDGDGHPDLELSNGVGIVIARQGACIPFAP